MNGQKNNNSLVSLLGGAALGAVAMYLMDPEQGQRRREHLGETAGEALRGTGGALGTAWERVAEGAGTLGQTLTAATAAAGSTIASKAADVRDSDAVGRAGHAIGDTGHYLGQLGQDLWENVRGLGAKLGSGASDFGEGVADRSRGAATSVGSYFGYEKEEEERNTIGYAMGALATAALGAGAMYFLDPQRGRARRAVAGGKVVKIVNDTGRAFRQAGQMCRDVTNRTRGTAHELQRSVVHEGPVAAEQLLQRVRSEMGHVVSHAGQIQVMTDAQGNVTLEGRVLASEIDALLTTVKRVAGVSVVTNRLDVIDRADQMGGFPSTGSAIPQM